MCSVDCFLVGRSGFTSTPSRTSNQIENGKKKRRQLMYHRLKQVHEKIFKGEPHSNGIITHIIPVARQVKKKKQKRVLVVRRDELEPKVIVCLTTLAPETTTFWRLHVLQIIFRRWTRLAIRSKLYACAYDKISSSLFKTKKTIVSTHSNNLPSPPSDIVSDLPLERLIFGVAVKGTWSKVRQVVWKWADKINRSRHHQNFISMWHYAL